MESKMEKAFSDYQVFINHGGCHTKNTLASLFYSDLLRLGLRVFLHLEELPSGNRVSPQIEAAINTSSVQIAIFSPTFAESLGCLEELCLMLQQPSSTFIPIFCDVKPSDLRDLNEGPYAEAFNEHKNRGWKEEDVDRWREALSNAADIEGHKFDTEKDEWGKFVFEIVGIVLSKVRREPLHVADHLVGLDEAAKNFYNEIKEQLKTSAGSTIVGIAGLGGSGKSTLATFLYNLKCSEFERSSFLYELSRSRSALTSLKKKLLFDLLGCPQSAIGNTQEWKSLLRQHLRGLSRVLIVLDDIDDQEQINTLLPALTDVLGKGSLIVITSQDKDLLARFPVKWYNIKLLDEKDAGELFCQHAFHTSEPPTGFADLVRELVKICGGYPFALKVLGEQLFGKQKRYWTVLLKNLQKNKFPDEIVQKMVKTSYNSLEEEVKMVFLDVACFFDELDIQLVVRVHGEVRCPLLDYIETLGQKCLVEFQWVEVDVHGQIKYNDGGHEDFCIEHWIGPRVRREFMSTYKDCKIGMHKFVKDIAKQIASEERDPWESCTEIQMTPLDYQISDSVQLPKGTTALGSLRRLIVVDDCIQEFPQMNFLKCFLKRLMKREASYTERQELPGPSAPPENLETRQELPGPSAQPKNLEARQELPGPSAQPENLETTMNKTFISGKELADFLLMDGIILKAWELIPKDFANNANTFEMKEDGDVVYFVFPSFLEDFAFKNGRYGECPIQNENRVFSDCLKGDDDRPALVHGGALNRFIVLHSNFEAQMQSIIDRKREQNIIFVGHSIGGAVATLATIWLLEKRVRQISPFCITFGCPLLGDARLGQAVGYEDWSGKFCHVVSQYDVIPRMFLAPVESIAEHVDAILPYWVSIMDNDSPPIQEACRTIFKNVLQYTSLFTENDSEESSIESPYRPFGTYLFCSRNGAACIEDPGAILNMLHLTMQSNEGNSFDARACVSEHTCYGDILNHICADLVNTRIIASPVSDSSFEVQMALILEAIGVGAEYKEHACVALRKAGEVKNEHDTITRQLKADLSKKQDAELIALSPKTLMATNRFVCEICNKGFQREQNLQLHRRGHNLPWKLRQRSTKEIRKRVYICPEPTCVHHDPSRALGELTGIKKHFCRKHGEKKWKCDKCSKRYSLQSDWKAHSKTCGTREYRCDCGTLFSRRDSFITHRAFCDALAEESARVTVNATAGAGESATRTNSSSSGDHNNSRPSSGCPVSASASASASDSPALDVKISTAPPPPPSPPPCPSPASLPQPPLGWGHAPGTGPRLSLWHGPGPGPPTSAQFNVLEGSYAFPLLMHRPPNIGGGSFATPPAVPPLAGNLFAGMMAPGGFTELMGGMCRPAGSLLSHQHQQAGDHSSSAHMSATALLQKAAQMGATATATATATNSSLLRGFGLSDSQHSSWHTSSTSRPGSESYFRRPEASLPCLPVPDIGGGNQQMGNGMQELMNSLSAGGLGLFAGNLTGLLQAPLFANNSSAVGDEVGGGMIKSEGGGAEVEVEVEQLKPTTTLDFLGLGQTTDFIISSITTQDAALAEALPHNSGSSPVKSWASS